MSNFIEAALEQVKSAWCSIAPQYYIDYQIQQQGKAFGFSQGAITSGSFAYQSPGCPTPNRPADPEADYPPGSTIDVPFYGDNPSSGSGNIDIFWGHTSNSYNLVTPSEGAPYCNVSTPQSNPLGPFRDANAIVNFPVSAQLEIYQGSASFACGVVCILRIKQRTGADITYNVIGNRSTSSSGYVIGFVDAYIVRPPAVAPPPRPTPPPVVPPPVNNYNLTWNLSPTVEINTPITLTTGPIKVNSDNEFYLKIYAKAGPDTYFNIPFEFEINAKPEFKIGSDNKVTTNIQVDIGPDKPLPPKEPVEPEPPFNFNGSWAKKICNIDGTEIITTEPYSGENFAGVQSAFSALNNVLAPWQDETIICGEDEELPLLYSVPYDQFRELNAYQPTIGLWFMESKEDAIAAGRAQRCLKVITYYLGQIPADPDAYLDSTVNYWENYTYQSGAVTTTYKSRSIYGKILVNTITKEEGIRVISNVLTYAGFTPDWNNYGRFSEGKVPAMGVTVGKQYIQTTVKFHSASLSSDGINLARRSPLSVLRAGPGRWAGGAS